jgi:hypothetical protein
MKDGRSPRIHLSLSIWSVLLIGLVLVEIRHLPHGLTMLLLPYLAMMARHWIVRLRQRNPIEPAMPREDAAGSPSQDEPDECTDPLGSDGCSSYDEFPQRILALPAEEQGTPSSRRTRARRRPKAPEPEPVAASWVQVGPGRFVRALEVSPEPPADEPGDPHGAPAPDEPYATSETRSIAEVADAVVPESEPEVNHAEKDAAEVIVPQEREIGDEATSGALAATKFLIGCPSGNPGDGDHSPPTSGAGAEIEPDDRREDMLPTEMPEMDVGVRGAGRSDSAA